MAARAVLSSVTPGAIELWRMRRLPSSSCRSACTGAVCTEAPAAEDSRVSMSRSTSTASVGSPASSFSPGEVSRETGGAAGPGGSSRPGVGGSGSGTTARAGRTSRLRSAAPPPHATPPSMTEGAAPSHPDSADVATCRAIRSPSPWHAAIALPGDRPASANAGTTCRTSSTTWSCSTCSCTGFDSSSPPDAGGVLSAGVSLEPAGRGQPRPRAPPRPKECGQPRPFT